MTKVLVCGGRDYNDKITVFKVLDQLHRENNITEIIQGGAKGADELAHLWAVTNNIYSRTFIAYWAKHGKRAGPIRNRQMLSEGKPDVVIAFPGNIGTKDMVSQSKKALIYIYFIDEKGNITK
jgi:hypothetical protein